MLFGLIATIYVVGFLSAGTVCAYSNARRGVREEYFIVMLLWPFFLLSVAVLAPIHHAKELGEKHRREDAE